MNTSVTIQPLEPAGRIECDFCGAQATVFITKSWEAYNATSFWNACELHAAAYRKQAAALEVPV